MRSSCEIGGTYAKCRMIAFGSGPLTPVDGHTLCVGTSWLEYAWDEIRVVDFGRSETAVGSAVFSVHEGMPRQSTERGRKERINRYIVIRRDDKLVQKEYVA